MSDNVVEVGVGTDATDRAFGGKKAVVISDEHKKELVEHYQRLHASLQDLERAEMKMWRRLHDGALNSVLLFNEVEKRARSPAATEQDTQDYQVLHKLRAAQDELGQLITATTSTDWKTVDLPSSLASLSLDSSVDRARFWAVVVGINAYQTLKNLDGACPDAVAMYEYFTKTLEVPADNIRLLLSPSPDVDYSHLTYSNPTRANILDALYEHLRDNPKVEKGDNVVFYFAGHGARYLAGSLFDNTDDTLEALCPADRGIESGGGPILDISDRELAIFLEELHAEKGDSITVILDCCHAGGATRDSDSLESTRAAAPLSNVLPKELLEAVDKDPRRKRGSRLAYDKDWEWDEECCVLLAACLDYELAKEKRFGDTKETTHGYFTRALLAVLTSKEGKGKTYADICKAVTKYMPMYKDRCVQNPLAVGTRQDAKLWYAADGNVFRKIWSKFSR